MAVAEELPLNEAHIDAAVRAMLCVKEAGGKPMDAVAAAAVAILYLEGVSKTSRASLCELLQQVMDAIAADAATYTAAMRITHEKMQVSRIILPGRPN